MTIAWQIIIQLQTLYFSVFLYCANSPKAKLCSFSCDKWPGCPSKYEHLIVQHRLLENIGLCCDVKLIEREYSQYIQILLRLQC